MEHDHPATPTCKISMTWNWFTIDACFISSSWRITHRGWFALTCLGVVLLASSLEGLRRLAREYEHYAVHQSEQIRSNGMKAFQSLAQQADAGSEGRYTVPGGAADTWSSSRTALGMLRRKKLQQQFVKATIHMVQFGVAYFVMLMAMYYNGYVILCILAGAWLGAFVWTWDQLEDEDGALAEVRSKPESHEATGCC